MLGTIYNVTQSLTLGAAAREQMLRAIIGLSLTLACLCGGAAPAQPDVEQRRQELLKNGQAEFWQARDPREALTLDRVTDPRAAWARIELLLQQAKGEGINEAEALLTKTLETLRRDTAARANAIRQRDGLGEDSKYNTSEANAFGWSAANPALDNDPLHWEFDILPTAPRSIGLAGRWRCELDDKAAGVATGYARTDFNDRDWPVVFAPARHGWERQHARAPYDGVGWYRKTVVVPAAWKGQDLRLHLGDRRGNVDWVAVNGHFLRPPDGDGSAAPHTEIPSRLVRFGAANVIAIRVLNRDGDGGLFGPDLRLSVAASDPGVQQFVCGAGLARQVIHRTPDVPTILTYSSALSPAAVVTTTQQELHLAGGAARGYRPPRTLSFPSRGKLESIDINETAALDPKTLGENWMLLWDSRSAPETPRPVMLVFEKRPTSIRFEADGFGARSIQLRFASEGARVAMIRPFTAIFSPELTDEHLDRLKLWSHALVKYPVGYVEQVTPDANRTRVRTSYEYLELKDDWNTPPLALAPVPMAFAEAMRQERPVKPEDELTDLGCRSSGGYWGKQQGANYFAAVGKTSITYSYSADAARQR